jgi:hypothetical protein
MAKERTADVALLEGWNIQPDDSLDIDMITQMRDHLQEFYILAVCRGCWHNSSQPSFRPTRHQAAAGLRAVRLEREAGRRDARATARRERNASLTDTESRKALATSGSRRTTFAPSFRSRG